MDGIKGIAKAIAAAVAPWVFQGAGTLGFTEVSQTGAESAVLSALLFVLVWLVPNKTS